MQVLCGTDIIEISRIKKAINNKKYNFVRRVFTNKEIEYCESKKEGKYEHYAARFAAKEAVFKAISKLLNGKYDISWKNVEILNTENQRPIVNFVNIEIEGIKNIDISISHCKEYAIAMVTAIV